MGLAMSTSMVASIGLDSLHLRCSKIVRDNQHRSASFALALGLWKKSPCRYIPATESSNTGSRSLVFCTESFGPSPAHIVLRFESRFWDLASRRMNSQYQLASSSSKQMTLLFHYPSSLSEIFQSVRYTQGITERQAIGDEFSSMKSGNRPKGNPLGVALQILLMFVVIPGVSDNLSFLQKKSQSEWVTQGICKLKCLSGCGAYGWRLELSGLFCNNKLALTAI